MRVVGNRQGCLCTNLSGEMAYESFRPASLDSVLPLSISENGINLLSRCSRKIGELSGMVRFLPNANMYLAMYVRKEALLSAQIEGTQCTFDDILDSENRKMLHRDIVDVVNYIKASNFALQRMNELPLCTRLLRETHVHLLSGVWGSDKQPGEVRASQNWIGSPGCGIANALFVPPNVDDMNEALSDLDKFINGASGVDPLVKAALVHYQFETIHPFLDGNGRLGRLLITLSLVNDDVLKEATFYPSYQLKLRRSEYYERLMAVRCAGDYEGWVTFFCECLLDSAEDAIDSMGRLVELHADNERKIRDAMGRAPGNGFRLLELLEEHPFVDIGFISDRLEISRSASAKLVETFLSLDILKVKDESRRRYRVFLYEKYLAILRAGGEPIAQGA